MPVAMSDSDQKLPQILIRTEQEAYDVLELALNDQLQPFGAIVFDGWPTLSLHLTGEKFHQSITPTVMRALLEFQKGIYRSYAAAKYDSPAKRLTEAEKDALEVRIDVKDGSSGFEINFPEVAVKLVEQIGGKMDPTQLLIAIVSIAVLYLWLVSY